MNSDHNNKETREKDIVRYNIIGIVMNLFLSACKITVGLITHAHAVILDGIDGLSDLASSVFSIFSVKIGAKKADKDHPFGYGRMEYLISMLVTVLVMLIGIRSIVSSVKDIIEPHDPPEYDLFVIILMSVSLVLKFSYGMLMRKKGQKLNSEGMIMTGNETLGDALTSIAILVAIAVKAIFDIDIEHYLCIGISLLIIYSSIGVFRECTAKILGTRADPEFRKQIRKMVIMEDGVQNVSNLVIHNYGEGVQVGSLDIEVDENMRAAEIGRLSRKIIRDADDFGLTLTSVGISGTNLDSSETAENWDRILDVIRKRGGIMRAYAFEEDDENKVISFRIVSDYKVQEPEKVILSLQEEIKKLFPEMQIEIVEGKEI